MPRPLVHKPDPKLDLVLERVVDVPPELVWKAWTTPAHLMKWFCPLPWKTVACKIDLRPGGMFHTVMQSPEGEKFPGTGCYLEVVENRKLVWTSVLLPGFRPATQSLMGIEFTGVVTLKPHRDGTRYTAMAMHKDPKACRAHEKMGFHDGWGTALDQLVALIKKRRK